MAKLINVIKDNDGELEKRQLPLVIDEKLTMVLDLIDVDFMCEYPKIRGKDKELFLRKFSMLSTEELTVAFQVSCKRLLDIVSEIVPCVGCRRSVERLFHQMKTGPGRSGLYPLVVTPEGVLILPEEVLKWPNVIGAMFHNHMAKLNNLSSSWSRSKKSSRCALHSLDAQRYVRPPLGSGWRALWECMVPFCKQEVATIDTSQLLSTLETYLQKHRFCTECRTKVMKAYSLLVDEPEERKSENGPETSVTASCDKTGNTAEEDSCSGPPVKEKGFIPSLYAGIRRCSPNNHIHVDQRTDYIMGLILAAEPELLGNRRERHAKTLEIAQEEVLVCVGLCLYERVHRIQLRLREEQTTCQLLALVAINALSTNFQLAVEMKQGISQLELLFQEFSREDRLKQKRKQVRKLKKRRKKQRKNAAASNTLQDNAPSSNDEEEKSRNSEEEEEEEEEVEDEDVNEQEEVSEYFGKDAKAEEDEKSNCNIKSYYQQMNKDRIINIVRNDITTKYTEKKGDSCYCLHYEGEENVKSKEKRTTKSPVSGCETRNRLLEKGGKKTSVKYENRECSTSNSKSGRRQESKSTKTRSVCRPVNDLCDTTSNSSGSSSSIYSKYSDKENRSNVSNNSRKKDSNNKMNQLNSNANKSSICDCCTGTQIDCGYGSADNNNISSNNGSGDSSVDSSEVACSEGFCNHDGTEECTFEIRDGLGSDTGKVSKKPNTNYDNNKNSIVILNSASQSLQQMLTETSVEREFNNHRTGECIIPVEEIQRYKSSMGDINEKRKELRQTLKSRFAQLCLKQQCDALPAL